MIKLWVKNYLYFFVYFNKYLKIYTATIMERDCFMWQVFKYKVELATWWQGRSFLTSLTNILKGSHTAESLSRMVRHQKNLMSLFRNNRREQYSSCSNRCTEIHVEIFQISDLWLSDTEAVTWGKIKVQRANECDHSWGFFNSIYSDSCCHRSPRSYLM